jgi:hypothetical protein
MSPSSLFSLGNSVALVLWIALAASLFVASIRRPVWFVTGFVAPALCAIVYIFLLVQGWGAPGGGFDSVEQVRALFAQDSGLTAGWYHFLAFDIFVGTWIARNSVKRGIPSLLVIPCLALTLFFGPTGLLAYLLLRLAFRRKERPA